jgi:type II secretory pathway component PulF
MPKLSSREKTFFYGQLQTLIAARLTLPRAAELISRHRTSPALASVLPGIAAELREGKPLAACLQGRPEAFSRYEAEVVAAGEEKDRLDKALDWLAELYADEFEAKRRVRVQYWYFGLTFAVLIVLLIVLNAAVIPVFKSMFYDWGARLPSLTEFVLEVNTWLLKYWYLLILPGGLTVYAGRLLWRRYPAGVSKLLTRVPWLGRAWITHEALRFSLILGQGLEQGVAPLAALEAAAPFVSHPYLREGLAGVAPFLVEGRSLATALKSIMKFPEFIVAFTHLGEEQGELGMALQEVWRSQSQAMRQRWDWGKAVGVIGMIIVAVLFGIVAIAMYLPIFNLAQILG